LDSRSRVSRRRDSVDERRSRSSYSKPRALQNNGRSSSYSSISVDRNAYLERRLSESPGSGSIKAFAAVKEIDSWSDANQEQYLVTDRGEISMMMGYDWEPPRPKPPTARTRILENGYQTTIWNGNNGPTLAEVRQAAHEGCHLCTLILCTWLVRRSNKLRHIRNDSILEDQRYQNYRIHLALKNGYLFGHSLTPGREQEYNPPAFGFKVLDTSTDTSLAPVSVNYSDDRKVMSASGASTAQQWFQNCIEIHGSRCVQKDFPVLPSRVIDVLGRSGDGQPFLFQTSGQRAQYATSSFCWGDCDLFTTTTSALAERCQNIYIDSLPRTFQSAFEVTCAFGFRYLWIDAICILQDSAEDCQKELGSMAQIYSNSTVTISAIGAINATSGSAINRNKLAMTDCPLSPTVA
jgi:hypothetical protein